MNFSEVDLDDIQSTEPEESSEVELISKEAVVSMLGEQWVTNATQEAKLESNKSATDRDSRKLTDEETEDALYGNPWLDKN